MTTTVKRAIWVLVGLIAAVAILDGALIGSAHLSVQDDANQAAFLAASQAQYRGVNITTAESAYAAAQTFANQHGETVLSDPADFALNADGSITLTLVRTAPTFLLNHTPFGHSWLHVEAKATSSGVGH